MSMLPDLLQLLITLPQVFKNLDGVFWHQGCLLDQPAWHVCSTDHGSCLELSAELI